MTTVPMAIEARRPWRILILLWLICLGLSGEGVLAATSPGGSSNETCPVTPEEWVEPDFSAEYQGKTILFCCAKCRRDFLADPVRYLPRLPQFGGGDAIPAVQPTIAAIRGNSAVAGAARPVRTAGKVHPLAVHFPIALILFAAFLECCQLIFRREIFAQGTRLTMPAAAASAIIAALLGWAAAATTHVSGEGADWLSFHRIAGTATAVLISLASIFRERATRAPGTTSRTAYRLFLAIAVVLVTVAGHSGGMLVFGPDHFTW